MFLKVIVSAFVAMVIVAVVLTSSFIATSTAYADSKGIQRTGDLLQFVPIIQAFTLTGYNEDYEGLKQLLLHSTVTMGTVSALKAVVVAKRPDYTGVEAKDSFPSGHTAWAFSSANFIHRRYNFKRAAGSYFVAAFVGISRITSDRHHVRDVLASIAISSTFAYLLVDKYEKDDTVNMVPFFSPESKQFGLKLSYNF